MKNIIYLLLLVTTVQLGEKRWCSVFPDRPCYFCPPEPGSQSSYCVWDSKEECEKNKQCDNEKCEENSNWNTPSPPVRK